MKSFLFAIVIIVVVVAGALYLAGLNQWDGSENPVTDDAPSVEQVWNDLNDAAENADDAIQDWVNN